MWLVLRSVEVPERRFLFLSKTETAPLKKENKIKATDTRNKSSSTKQKHWNMWPKHIEI